MLLILYWISLDWLSGTTANPPCKPCLVSLVFGPTIKAQGIRRPYQNFTLKTNCWNALSYSASMFWSNDFCVVSKKNGFGSTL